jgi:hypothetical protein
VDDGMLSNVKMDDGNKADDSMATIRTNDNIATITADDNTGTITAIATWQPTLKAVVSRPAMPQRQEVLIKDKDSLYSDQ